MHWLTELLESPELATALVLAVPLIVALVQLLKGQGLPARWAPLASVVLGVVLAIAALVAEQYPEAGGWLGAILLGVILGLAASGLYSGGKAVKGG